MTVVDLPSRSRPTVRRSSPPTTDAVVVGGGPAGAGLAIGLARGGVRVTLLEREKRPVDKVCGEFLSHEAVRYLRQLGIDPPALGAVPIDTLCLAHRRNVVATALPFEAFSLSRRVLDEALLKRAQEAGVDVRRGCHVVGLDRVGGEGVGSSSKRVGIERRGVEGRGVEGRGVEGRGVEGRGVERRDVERRGIDQVGVDPSGFDHVGVDRFGLDHDRLDHDGLGSIGLERAARVWRANVAVGEPVAARAAFLASGKHDVRGRRRPPGLQNDLVAFKMHWRLNERQTRALSRQVEIVLFEGGYLGLEPIEGGLANLCLLVRRDRLRALNGGWESLMCAIRAESPHLETRLAGAEPRWAKPLALATIPYGHVQRRDDGIFRLGDQAAVIPSFSGDGVSIALHSAAVAASTFLGGGDAAMYQRRLARETSGRVLFATLLSMALVRAPSQWLLASAARGWPRLMTNIASATRLPAYALSRALHESHV